MFNFNNRHIRPAALLCAAAAWVIPVANANAQALKPVVVPVVVNIMAGSGVTRADVDRALGDANKILKQAQIFVQVSKVNENCPNPGTPGNGADMAPGDHDPARKAGLKELPDGKGFKLWIAHRVNVTNANDIGLGYILGQCAIVQPYTNPVTHLDELGISIAHEAGHVLGLPDLTTPGSANQLMHGDSQSQTGTTITPAEAGTMNGNAQRFTTQTLNPLSGSTPTSAVGNSLGLFPHFFPRTNTTPPAWQLIDVSGMFSTPTDSAFHAQIGMAGLIPSMGTAQYFLLINSDNNPSTGISMAGRPGVDKLVQVNITNFAASATIRNAAGGPTTTLPASISTNLKDSRPISGSPTLSPAFNTVNIDIPRALLPINGNIAAVTATSMSSTAPTDTVDFQFLLDQRQNSPQLAASTGQVVTSANTAIAIAGSQFTPNADISLMIDGIQIASAVANAGGTFNTAITLPQSLATGDYFISAQETISSKFGFSVVHAIAPPAATDLGNIANLADGSRFLEVLDGSDRHWLKFLVTDSITDGTNDYLDINTISSSLSASQNGRIDDTMIGLYDQNGSLIASDDDDGPGYTSQLSFGQRTPTRPPSGDGLAGDGRDGGLPPGLYYLVVGGSPLVCAPLFSVTSNSSAQGTIQVNFRRPVLCTADFNHDGGVDFFDYLDFVDAFSAASLAADFNGDNSIDFFDYLDYVDAFSMGCPN